MKRIASILACFQLVQASAQTAKPASSDSAFSIEMNRLNNTLKSSGNSHHLLKTFVAPAVLITYGFVSLENDGLKRLDKNLRNEIKEDNPHFHTTIDNYLQYAPGLSVYLLNTAGVHGKNNFKDRTMIYLLSNTIVGATTQSLKAITKVQRPDGFGTNAFPSGHTATAFAGAEFLRAEYAQKSAWYGIAGYAAATATGILRVYNNRHWLRDVVAGAGYGILSTRLAYLAYPVLQRKLWKGKHPSTMVLPYYEQKSIGFNLVHVFHS